MQGSGDGILFCEWCYLFFSLAGYTDWFETVSDENVLLLTLDSLYE